MDQDENALEEGEIEDEGEEAVNVYEPLKRPENYAMDIPQKRFQEVGTNYSETEEESGSSESDSDSDSGVPNKKKSKRIKLIPKLPSQRSDKLKKYDIWSTRAQEDVLAETMVSCDVSIKDRSRQSENYDFTFAAKYYGELEAQQGTKRSREDMKNKNFRPQKRSSSHENDYRGKSKEIPDLLVTKDNDIQDIVKDIAHKLSEERDDLILKIVETMGKERTIEFFKETQLIEKEGGMPILNQTRRRTPGGVFLYLVRNDYHITPEQRKEIFSEVKQNNIKEKKQMKKKKLQKLKANTNLERNKILPELLTRAELLAKENPVRTLKKTDEGNCTNPPPSPETDHHESGDGMESQLLTLASVNNSLNRDMEGRNTLEPYDDDFLDITCDNDMDLF